MTPIDTLLSRLSGVKESGNGWTARCPAHDDSTASLSVAVGDNGGVVLCCHAGCGNEAIVAAMGRTMRDLAPDTGNGHARPPGKPRKASIITYPTADAAVADLERRHGPHSATWTYHDADGQPVGVVARWDLPGGKKDIRPASRHSGGWCVGGMDAPRPLYCLPDLAGAQRVFVTEGEKAADAVRSLGLVATTSAHGAQSPGKTDWRPLAGKDVVILPDHDAPGEQYAADVAALCHAAGAACICVVRLPGLPVGGDAVEWIGAHGDAAEPGGMRRELETLIDAAPEWAPTAAEPEPWPEIVPFEAVDLPEFPTAVLPAVLRQWVEAESHATQTPADLAALLALAVCSSCIARRVVVEPRPGWREPTNLFTAILLEPGNRKSAVFADAIGPLREIESELIESARPAFARAMSDRRQDESRLKKLEDTAAKTGDHEARKQAGDLAAELALQPEPSLPRLIVDDATAEKLGMVLADQGGRLASMSPEGGVFDLMAGLYSKSGIPQFGVYLQGHSGDDLVTDRVTRESVRVERPALTAAYTIQPAVIEGLAEQVAFRGRGLLARFLYAAPQSWIGRREIATTPVDDATSEAYRDVVRMLAANCGNIGDDSQPFILRLTPDAATLLIDWETKIEAMLDDGGEMESARDWGAKLAGATLRLAAVMHCVERGAAGRIEGATIAAAVEIARYLIPHAESVLDLMTAKEGQGVGTPSTCCGGSSATACVNSPKASPNSKASGDSLRQMTLTRPWANWSGVDTSAQGRRKRPDPAAPHRRPTT